MYPFHPNVTLLKTYTVFDPKTQLRSISLKLLCITYVYNICFPLVNFMYVCLCIILLVTL